MSINDRVCVSYKEKDVLGIITQEYNWAKIIYLPIDREQRMYSLYKVIKWEDVDWIKQAKLIVESGVNNEKSIKVKSAEDAQLCGVRFGDSQEGENV